jgi:hypothetical protein
MWVSGFGRMNHPMRRYTAILVVFQLIKVMSAGPTAYDSETTNHNIIIPTSVSLIVGILCVFFLYHFLRDRSLIMEKLLQKADDPNTTSSRKRTIRSFFASVLPIEFENKTWFEVYVKMMKYCHVWVSTNAHASDPSHIIDIFDQQNSIGYTNKTRRSIDDLDFRSTRLVLFAARICHFLFIDTMILRLLLSDSSSCNRIKSKLDCNQTITIYIVSTECFWNAQTQQCEFNDRNRSANYMAIVIVSGAILLLSTFLDKVFYWIGRYGINSYFYSVVSTTVIGRGGRTSDDNLQDIEATGGHYGDEFTNIQNMSSILMKGARITKLLEELDQLSPENEYEVLQSAARNQQWYKAYNDHSLGKSVSKIIINQLEYFGYDFMDILDLRPISKLAEVS